MNTSPLPISLFLLFLLLLLFSLYYISILRRQVQTKTKELQRLSETDPLTGFPNRVKLDDRLKEELLRFKRYRRPVSLILMSIETDTTHSESEDDQIIREFAFLIRRNIRNTDTAGRWSDDKFLIICPETDTEKAEMLSKKLNPIVHRHTFCQNRKCRSFLGVSSIHENDELYDLINRMEESLIQSQTEI